MDVIDGSLQSASPCPPELLIMAPRYSDPGNIQRSRHTRLPKSGAMDRGYHLLCWTSNTWNWDGSERFNEVLKKFRSAEYRESVALKKRRILAWIYSGTLYLNWYWGIAKISIVRFCLEILILVNCDVGTSPGFVQALIVSRYLNPQNTQQLSIRIFPYSHIFRLTHYTTRW